MLNNQIIQLKDSAFDDTKSKKLITQTKKLQENNQALIDLEKANIKLENELNDTKVELSKVLLNLEEKCEEHR